MDSLKITSDNMTLCILFYNGTIKDITNMIIYAYLSYENIK